MPRCLKKGCILNSPTKLDRAVEVKEVIIPGLSFYVVMNGQRVRHYRASATNIKKFHLSPFDLRHDSGGEFAHLAYGEDLGLAEPSTVASHVYSLTDREVVRGERGF